MQLWAIVADAVRSKVTTADRSIPAGTGPGD